MTNNRLNKTAKFLLSVLLMISVFSNSLLIYADSSKKYIPAGIPFGAKIYCDGLYVSGFTDKSEFGMQTNPSIKGGMKAGDIIKKIGDTKILSTDTLYQCIKKSNGQQINVTVNRNDKEQVLKITPFKCSDGEFRLGINVKDSIAGIGTVTYICPDDNSFGGLGHGICDYNTGNVIPMLHGEVYNVRINSINKGSSGSPGEIRGSFIDSSNGKITKNTDRGVFGNITNNVLKENSPFEIAKPEEVSCGQAQLICTLDSKGPKKYNIEVESIDGDNNNKTKNFIIKIADPDLISKTGGIVQGMSGSPIIQNGKLVGAVTHVFVNDPVRGYGIFIKNMIDSAQ